MYNVLTGATSANNNSLTAVLFSSPEYAASFNLSPNGTFSYFPMSNPPSGFNGTDSFQFMANDGTLNSLPVKVTLNWTSTPVAQDDSYLLPASGQLSVSAANGVLANDFNPMGEIVGAQLYQGIDPSIGTLNFNPDGSFTFAAGQNFQGQASFSYQLFIQVGNVVMPGIIATVRIVTSAVVASTTSLLSVNFSTNATITSDSGEFTPGPQFQYGVPFDGGINGRVNEPISFTMGTQVGLTPTFNVSPNLAPLWAALGNNILVRAVSDETADGLTFTLGATPMRLNANNQLATQTTKNPKLFARQRSRPPKCVAPAVGVSNARNESAHLPLSNRLASTNRTRYAAAPWNALAMQQAEEVS